MDADALFEEGAAALRAGRLAGARDLFARAGKAGRHDAAVIHCNLTASGGNWSEGVRLLAELARTDRRCRRQAELIRAMDFSARLVGEVISEAPHLTMFRAPATPSFTATRLGMDVAIPTPPMPGFR